MAPDRRWRLPDFGCCGCSGTPPVSEMKVFSAKDGQGLSLAHTMGIQTGFITGRHSPAVVRRAEELKVNFVFLGQAKKTEAFEECVRRAGVTVEEVAYMVTIFPTFLWRSEPDSQYASPTAPELAAVCHYTTRRHAGGAPHAKLWNSS